MEKVPVDNVFLPAKEITDARQFAGRKAQLLTLVRALGSAGTHIVIHGRRGVGKSSVARQLEAISKNDKEVLKKNGITDRHKFNFTPIFYTCDKSIGTVEGLLARLLTEDAALKPFVEQEVLETVIRGAVKGGVTAIVAKLGGEVESAIRQAPPQISAEVVAIFKNTISKAAKSSKDGLLIILDEFDTIQNRMGMASLMKALTGQPVRFAIVGVSNTIQELLVDHESIARQITNGIVEVPPMTMEEMKEIIANAERISEVKFRFSADAIQWICKVARGHPYYVHLLGQQALTLVMDKGGNRVEQVDAENALDQIVLTRAAPLQEATYKKAVGHSYQREAVLKELAAHPEDEIHTTGPYQKVSDELLINAGQVSVYVGQLTKPEYGEVLEKTRERYYRFKDSLFKVYADFRPFIHKSDD